VSTTSIKLQKDSVSRRLKWLKDRIECDICLEADVLQSRLYPYSSSASPICRLSIFRAFIINLRILPWPMDDVFFLPLEIPHFASHLSLYLSCLIHNASLFFFRCSQAVKCKASHCNWTDARVLLAPGHRPVV
jgi:hypothetical protein